MFDVSFGEFALIGLVALVVLGPERLPKVARTFGHLLGRAQRYAATVKADINREMQLEELKTLQQQMESSAQEVQTSVNAEMHSLRESMDEASLFPAHEVADLAAPAPAESLIHQDIPAATVEPLPALVLPDAEKAVH